MLSIALESMSYAVESTGVVVHPNEANATNAKRTTAAIIERIFFMKSPMMFHVKSNCDFPPRGNSIKNQIARLIISGAINDRRSQRKPAQRNSIFPCGYGLASSRVSPDGIADSFP